MGRMYDDMLRILDSLVIKYSYRADEFETQEIRSHSEKYMLACLKQDNFFTYYNDYTIDEFKEVDKNITIADINSYMYDLRSTPIALQNKLLTVHRKHLIDEYEELNPYYRILNGLPPIGVKRMIFYVPEEIANQYDLPTDIPIHEIEDKLGKYYISLLESCGYLDTLREKYQGDPDAEFLTYVGTKRIPIHVARKAKNFAILYLSDSKIMESTFNEFIRVYEQCRSYFMSTIYIFEYRSIITNYDKFIALCIFVMTMQQVSVRVLKNATDREFYDVRAIQILYETYGLPFNNRVDDTTQKLICQNVNLLIQNKACDKVLLDICSILGFSGVEIYEYYLMKKRLFDKDGRPIFKKKKVINKRNGQEEEVYDYESMFELSFQRIPLVEEDIHSALQDPLKRVEYYDVVYYDPFWWEDDDLKKEIWETEYNVMESKYLGLTIPYRLTELLFQSVYLFRIIEDNDIHLKDIMVDLPKITEKPCNLIEVIMLLSAMMARRYHIPGKIYTMPSQLLHIVEVLDQEINKEEGYKEVLGFNFDAFSKENIENTKAILKSFLVYRDYVVSNGHDVDIRGDGTQDTYSPTHLVRFEENVEALDQFEKYLLVLSNDNFGYTEQDKIDALNAIFQDVQNLYHFLSYRMSIATDPDEIYALRKFYEVAFYTREIPKMFEMEVRDNPNYTYENWLEDHAPHLFTFLIDLPDDQLYLYINHAIYRLSLIVNDIGTLYVMNDGVSPLQELLIQLINFFRSFTTDMIDFNSIMLMDWRMENIIRLLDSPKYLHKIITPHEDIYTMTYHDFIKKFCVHYELQDLINAYDDVTICGKLEVADPTGIKFKDEIARLRSSIRLRDEDLCFTTVSSGKATLYLDDKFHFEAKAKIKTKP